MIAPVTKLTGVGVTALGFAGIFEAVTVLAQVVPDTHTGLALGISIIGLGLPLLGYLVTEKEKARSALLAKEDAVNAAAVAALAAKIDKLDERMHLHGNNIQVLLAKLVVMEAVKVGERLAAVEAQMVAAQRAADLAGHAAEALAAAIEKADGRAAAATAAAATAAAAAAAAATAAHRER